MKYLIFEIMTDGIIVKLNFDYVETEAEARLLLAELRNEEEGDFFVLPVIA